MKQAQMMRIEDVHPYANNPRKNDDAVELVANSIREFGFQQPIVVDKDHVIIVGHTRLKAAKKLHMEEVPVVVADDLTEEQAKAYRLADNKTGEKAVWDDDLLGAELEALKDMGFDLSTIGFDDDIQIPNGNEEAIDDEYDPEPPEDPVTRKGDVWILGRHRLMCGDACDANDVAILMDGEMADLVITDPPYNVDYTGKTKDALKIQNDNMGDDSFLYFLRDSFRNTNEAMKEGAAIYVFHTEIKGYIFRQAFRDTGFKLSDCLIWVKNRFVLGHCDYQRRHEPILYGWKEGAGHYFLNDRSQDTVFMEDEIDFKEMKKADLVKYLEQLRDSYEDRTTVIYEDRPSRSDLHPTMKPVSLIGRLMKNSSKPGWKVLDLFGGSGTTMIAAEQIGRQAYLMELDPVYADVIVNRYATWKGNADDIYLETASGKQIPYWDVVTERRKK